jgi:hypothetical protein
MPDHALDTRFHTPSPNPPLSFNKYTLRYMQKSKCRLPFVLDANSIGYLPILDTHKILFKFCCLLFFPRMFSLVINYFNIHF